VVEYRFHPEKLRPNQRPMCCACDASTQRTDKRLDDVWCMVLRDQVVRQGEGVLGGMRPSPSGRAAGTPL